MLKTNLQIINQLKQFLENYFEQKEFYTKNAKNFIRKRIITFPIIVVFIINMSKKSLSVELSDFFDIFEKENKVKECTKSAFSQARYKLKHEFFIAWNEALKKEFYTNNEDRVKRWNGFILNAVDGSTSYLMKKDEIIDYFGTQSNQFVEVPMARVMNSYDVLNNINLNSCIAPIKIGENKIATDWIKHYPKDYLSIYDRGFASFTIMYIHLIHSKDFLIRMPKNFYKAVRDFFSSNKKDEIIEITPSNYAIKQLKEMGYNVDKDITIKFRLVKVTLSTGEIEVLATSLINKEKYCKKIFKKLYNERWGVETEYGKLKNNLQMEVFSGHTVEAIKQDFYAMIFTSNIHSLIIGECEEEIEHINQKRKHDYQVNRNVSLGLLKGTIVELFLFSLSEDVLDKLKKRFIKNLEPIRNDRKYKRNKKSGRLNKKYQTFTNYRRAI